MMCGFPPILAIPLQFIAGFSKGEIVGNLAGPGLVRRSEVLLVFLRLASPDDVCPASSVGDLKSFLLTLFR